jgi:sortase A
LGAIVKPLSADAPSSGAATAAHGDLPALAPARKTRRLRRVVGTAFIVTGVAALLWVLVVWLWQDPFTALYTRHEQHVLVGQYERQVRAFQPTAVPSTTSPRRERLLIAREAAQYRRTLPAGAAIGWITVARLNLKMIFLNGTDEGSLERGPGRALQTYMPGEGQLVYIAGHRTTFLAPFSHIDSLRPGDRVTLKVPYGTFTYRVFKHVIVPADDLAVLRSHGKEVVARPACHPRVVATHRYIVYARLARVTLPSGRIVSPS